jgi:hypothetical protein
MMPCNSTPTLKLLYNYTSWRYKATSVTLDADRRSQHHFSERRCYTMSSIPKKVVIDLADDEDAWNALDEAEGITSSAADKRKGKETDVRLKWLPGGLDPVLEELPK